MIKKTKVVAEEKDSKVVSTKEYAQFLVEIKKQVKAAQVKAIFAVNTELLKLYWFIGQAIVTKQQECGWGSNVIEKLAQDLQNEFPGLGGFSRTNVFNMRAFYLAYEKVQ